MKFSALTPEEEDLLKVLKMNQDESLNILHDPKSRAVMDEADKSIAASLAVLKQLGKNPSEELRRQMEADACLPRQQKAKPEIVPFEDLAKEARARYPEEIRMEDILTPQEINRAMENVASIERDFSEKTGICNKTDMAFLVVATALQTAKSLLFPLVAEKLGYGNSIDKSARMAHDDKSIKSADRAAKDGFKETHQNGKNNGRWLEILYQTPAYDTAKGSQALGLNVGGAYHRMYTLGHDPILGWLFGTMNILTDTVTFNTFDTLRAARNPLRLTGEPVFMPQLFAESWQCAHENRLNLPAAVFAQACHLKSDVFTKLGLPIPLLTSFNEDLAGKLYRANYDALCFSRDLAIVGGSFTVSRIIDILIVLTHGLFRPTDISQDLYEVRTRKILLISNSIASTSSIIAAYITRNPKNLDIGGLINTAIRLFSDLRFITRIKQEFIESELYKSLKPELDEIDRLYDSL